MTSAITEIHYKDNHIIIIDSEGKEFSAEAVNTDFELEIKDDYSITHPGPRFASLTKAHPISVYTGRKTTIKLAFLAVNSPVRMTV